jgi:hypothetical protein
VLKTQVMTTQTDQLRAYTHCTSKSAVGFVEGSVTVLLINLSNTTIMAINDIIIENSKQNLLTMPRQEYILSSAAPVITGQTDERSLLASNMMLLNGKILELTKTNQIPILNGRKVSAEEALHIQPLTYGFIVFEHAHASACMMMMK